MLNQMMRAWLAVVMIFTIWGCGRDETSSPGGSSSSGKSVASLSGDQKEAADRTMAEINKRWTKAADGWITHKAEGSRFAPIHFIQQVKEIAVAGVESFDLTETDKLNGFEWAGKVTFKRSPVREAGTDGYVLQGSTGVMVDRPKGRWSQWLDSSVDDVRVQKVKGQWRVSDSGFLMDGQMPQKEDYANAGIAAP